MLLCSGSAGWGVAVIVLYIQSLTKLYEKLHDNHFNILKYRKSDCVLDFLGPQGGLVFLEEFQMYGFFPWSFESGGFGVKLTDHTLPLVFREWRFWCKTDRPHSCQGTHYELQ